MGSVERTSGTGRTRSGVAVAIAAAAALTLAACGSSGETTAAKASSPASTTTTSAEPTSSTATPGAAAGAATLDATGGGRGDGGSSARSSTDTTDTTDTGDGAAGGAAGGGEVAPDVTWSLGATDYRGVDGLEITYDCPPDGELTSVWGTGTYTDDSSVCSAAVHAGLITRVDGGSVVIEISPGLEAYDPSTANGVTSLAYGPWDGSFTFTVG